MRVADSVDASDTAAPGDLPPAAARALDVARVPARPAWSVRPQNHRVAYCSRTMDRVVDGHYIESLTLRVERQTADNYPGHFWTIDALAFIDNHTRNILTDHHHSVTEAGEAVANIADNIGATLADADLDSVA